MMNLTDTLKEWVLKKPAAPKRSKKAPVENPYLAMRRTWNDHVQSVVSAKQTWQFIGIMGLLIGLAAVGGMIHIGSQSKFIPYVVEVDSLGQARAAGPAAAASRVDRRIIHASVAEFISDARMVTPDVALQRKAIFRLYSKLSPNDPATAKMNEWLNATTESKPSERAKKEMVSIEIVSAMPQTADTWQVDWIETTRDRQGVLKGRPVNWRALVTVYVAETTARTSEKQIRDNPMGIFVSDFTWSRLTNGAN